MLVQSCTAQRCPSSHVLTRFAYCLRSLARFGVADLILRFLLMKLLIHFQGYPTIKQVSQQDMLALEAGHTFLNEWTRFKVAFEQSGFVPTRKVHAATPAIPVVFHEINPVRWRTGPI
jgi:hypothetical protein